MIWFHFTRRRETSWGFYINSLYAALSSKKKYVILSGGRLLAEVEGSPGDGEQIIDDR